MKGKDPDPESVYYVPANIAWPDPPTMHGDYKLVKNLVVAGVFIRNFIRIVPKPCKYRSVVC